MERRVSTGVSGIDDVIDMLRLGDNVVWQVDSLDEYRKVTEPYVAQAKKDGRRIIYIRFGTHRPVLDDTSEIAVYSVPAEKGFEHFAAEVHRIIEAEGLYAFYVFDCLTDLLKYWHSDYMIGNFFKVTCPYLFQLDTIAYFALIRDSHTKYTVSRIRETTQLLLDLYNVNGNYYLHPLKVWERHSPTMFLPHRLSGDSAICVSSSSEASFLFSDFRFEPDKLDYWDVIFNDAYTRLSGSEEEQREAKRRLVSLLLCPEPGQDDRRRKMFELCSRYFTLRDLINIKHREIGTGLIGGKTVGMLLARKILESDEEKRFTPLLELHDSFYIGADVFYTYIVQNNCWFLCLDQKTEDGYYKFAPQLREQILAGHFSDDMQELFRKMLDYYGQSPIIVRSSSLLEDNFGNAFAGKYDSVFCANQGTPEQRYAEFENAVKTVYASTMNRDALDYRRDRGLMMEDEQMALLVQRVSGDHYGNRFFPHMAGVGNSSNLYVWDKSLSTDSGMLRLVMGLGTRAVDRTEGDYAQIVYLGDPNKKPPTAYQDARKFSQHYIDYIDTEGDRLAVADRDKILDCDLRMDKSLISRVDWETEEIKRRLNPPGGAYIIDFSNLFQKTDFIAVISAMLRRLEAVYEYPVDTEFCINFSRDGSYRLNLLQCRPLQTRGLGKPVALPAPDSSCFFETHGDFMGGNVHYKVDHVVFVRADPYLALSENDRYGVARCVGELNAILNGKNAILIGPGRWGTTTTSLGVPVHFTELCHMLGIFEVSYKDRHLLPELSYGSHFFQDLVESGVFYGAIMSGERGVIFSKDFIESRENILTRLLPGSRWGDVVTVVETPGLELFADTVSQRMICTVPPKTDK